MTTESTVHTEPNTVDAHYVEFDHICWDVGPEDLNNPPELPTTAGVYIYDSDLDDENSLNDVEEMALDALTEITGWCIDSARTRLLEATSVPKTMNFGLLHNTSGDRPVSNTDDIIHEITVGLNAHGAAVATAYLNRDPSKATDTAADRLEFHRDRILQAVFHDMVSYLADRGQKTSETRAECIHRMKAAITLTANGVERDPDTGLITALHYIEEPRHPIPGTL